MPLLPVSNFAAILIALTLFSLLFPCCIIFTLRSGTGLGKVISAWISFKQSEVPHKKKVKWSNFRLSILRNVIGLFTRKMGFVFIHVSCSLWESTFSVLWVCFTQIILFPGHLVFYSNLLEQVLEYCFHCIFFNNVISSFLQYLQCTRLEHVFIIIYYT